MVVRTIKTVDRWIFRISLLLFCAFASFDYLRAGVECKVVRYSITVSRSPADPDGYPRSVIRVVDDQLAPADKLTGDRAAFPGPTIRAQLGDTLEVTVNNAFSAETTSLHFHGLHMLNNPWMDGVPYVTQWPIQPRCSFTYRFNVTQTGTFWYHSHTGHQHVDGLLGPLVLDYPNDGPDKGDPVKATFPYVTDRVLLIQDWFHEPEENLSGNLHAHHHAFTRSDHVFRPSYPWRPHSLLMNGRGYYNCSHINTTAKCWDRDPCRGGPQCVQHRQPFHHACREEPWPEEEVRCYGRYVRLRLINGAGNAPIKVWIDRHNLTVVARDGVETVPLTVRYVAMPVGQRLDVIVGCDLWHGTPKKYHIFATLASGFLPHGADTPPIEEFVSGLLTYSGARVTETPLYHPLDFKKGA